MIQRLMVFLALICCQSMTWSQEAAVPPPGTASSTSGPIEEVEVRGTRARLHEMRQEINKLEDKFYAEYNRLNTDERYDISCEVEAMTGSSIRTRVCRPQFVNDATAEEASALMEGEVAPSPDQIIQEQFPDFKKNVLQVLSSSKELYRLLKERNEVATRYETLHARMSGRETKQLKQSEQAK